MKYGFSPAMSLLKTAQVGSFIKIQNKNVSRYYNYMTPEVYGKHASKNFQLVSCYFKHFTIECKNVLLNSFKLKTTIFHICINFNINSF